LEEVKRELENPELWGDPSGAQALGKEKVQLEKVVFNIQKLQAGLEDAKSMLDLAIDEQDSDLITDISVDISAFTEVLEKLEFQRMFSNEMDPNNAFVEIQSGSGGTEAQDWAEMLLRMYLRWCHNQGFQTEVIDMSSGEVAGIKNATIKVEGEYAYGWLRTETGVHRLVRKSPFDSGNRRHTSFAAVFISPEVDESFDIEINPKDLKIDTYRASGAGGQHVNRTDSAIRITHIPSGAVVQCQSDRSQHKNRAQAMSQLKAKLYELEMRKRNAEKQILEESKSDIGWGSQIRSYVLDDSRIKDLRTGVETSNTQAVLDGENLELFIEASLKSGL
jgi:peptide chain release factor 2